MISNDIDIEQQYKDKATSLMQIGINGIAWGIDDTVQVIKQIRKAYPKAVILGGDILIRKDDKIDYYYANWYYEPSSSTEDYLRSNEKTLKYLGAFDDDPNRPQLLVDLVIDFR